MRFRRGSVDVQARFRHHAQNECTFDPYPTVSRIETSRIGNSEESEETVGIDPKIWPERALRTR